MKLSISLILTFFCFQTAIAQPFVIVPSGLPAIGRSAVAFADFDNDNDLDIVMCGLDISGNPLGKIFLNIEGAFTEAPAGITGLFNCSIALADYDLDGLVDFVTTGQGTDGYQTILYRNQGNGSFYEEETAFIAAGSDGDVAWNDYDNDGFPDLMIAGGWDSRLYRNDGDGTFNEVNSGITIMNTPSLDWGDCDNDGDSDLLMVGDAGSVAETFIYLNDKGTFTRLEIPVEGAVGGTASWGDYDNDGYLDILITGKDLSLVPVSYIYHNNGDNTFSFANAGFIGTALGPADWIDYDNDGDLDVLLAGENAGCGNASTHIYTNNGAGGFDEFPAGLPFVERASSAWGDYDNDGDSDLLLTGLSGDPISILYRNELQTGVFQPNTPPDIPGNLNTYISGDYAVISWGRASDLQSPQMAISYNVMAGTSIGGIDLVSPQADIITGDRYQVGTGNAGNNDFMVFRNLAPGEYYFRVQAVDQAFKGSAFSEAGSFTVLPTNSAQHDTPVIRIFIAESALKIINYGLNEGIVSLIAINGETVWKGELKGNDFNLSMDGFPKGIYLVKLIADGKQVIGKVIW